MLKISNLKIKYNYTMEDITKATSERLRIDKSRISTIEIVNKLLNISNDDGVYFNIAVKVSLLGDEREVLYNRIDKSITEEISIDYVIRKKKLQSRPVIIGCGPAGLFAGLVLAKSGAMPIIIEQGKNIDERLSDIQNLRHNGLLNKNSNVQFGEGGAGAYSDGKLKIGRKDSIKMFILKEMVKNGAPEEILYLDKPHIGTDKLSRMVKNIRKEILSLGGEILFNCKMNCILEKSGKIFGIKYILDNMFHEIYTDKVILAIGNSSDETFRNLYSAGIAMESRPVSIGVRIEHPAEYIDKLVYSKHVDLIKERADYRMVVHLPDNRGVYTFCMCPGGEVIAASSNEGCVVTNGMSYYKRNAQNSNSALLVTMKPEDCDFVNALSVLNFQRKIESDAFICGGGGNKAPVQKLNDFLRNRESKCFGDVYPSFRPGTEFSRLDKYLPEYITGSLRKAIYEMDDWMPGFIFPDAIMTGPETRSSSPVRILRNDKFQSVSISGLFPCGEGGGYSGGIISAAVDGVKCAEEIINNA